jgi:hypothetical protein
MLSDGSSIFRQEIYLPLSREVTVTSRDTVEDGVESVKVLGLKDRIVGLGRRIHLVQDFLRESLGNPDNHNLIRERELGRLE